ncbi:helix-turn-helix domain-containing protein [Streptomyces sp. NPDC059452]|uniref:helix-turn-helix domain-containing protein n=1 Tax=Streptomyces sp. NPDC059452 TaxID=3346835 RepID=UPI0036ADBE52
MARGSVTFGVELRRRREAAGVSLRALARAVRFSASHLSKVERGEKNASVALAQRCDHELSAGGALRDLVHAKAPRKPPISDGPVDGGAPWATPRRSTGGVHDLLAPDQAMPGQPDSQSVELTWCLTSAPVGSAEVARALGHFRRLYDECRSLGQVFGPMAVREILASSINSLRGIAGSAHPADRAAALRLAARFAEYAGWMTQEADDELGALWWNGRAAALATAADDTEFVAYTLIRRAEMALYRDDARSVVELARRADAQSRSARVRGLAAQREAQGHALMGHDAACLGALGRAAELLAEEGAGEAAGQAASRTAGQAAGAVAAAGGDPVPGSAHLAGPAEFVSGWCMHDLGRSAEAVDVLAGGLETIPAEARRARARYGARLMLALAEAGELAEACAMTEAVTASVVVLDSATIRADLRRLNRALNRWPRHSDARQASHHIAAALHTGGHVRGHTPPPFI